MTQDHTRSERSLDAGKDGTGHGRAQHGLLAESGRVEAFSDGVLAIVITLLVLDLHAPEQRGAMLHGLLKQSPVYLAYFASFAYVGVIWVNHHQLFTRIAVVDTAVLWRNLLLLLTTSVLPFPTAVLGSAFQHGSRADEVTALVFYALVSAAMAGTWLVLYRYLRRSARLLTEGTTPLFFSTESRRAAIGVAAYGVAALLAFWQPLAGLVLACMLPVYYGVTSEGFRPVHRARGERKLTL